MKTVVVQWRSFTRPVQLLALNQLTINIGFYMLMPYLANYLAGDLGLAVWLVGLILGIRNFSQQGMFLLGGSLADRWGYKPMILTGLVLRTLGFALLGLVTSVPALVHSSPCRRLVARPGHRATHRRRVGLGRPQRLARRRLLLTTDAT